MTAATALAEASASIRFSAASVGGREARLAGFDVGIPAGLVRGRAHLLVLLVAFAAVIAVDRVTAFRPVENALVAARMRAAPVAASGDFVFVAIDSRSLRALGHWPWPRHVFARMIERLVDAGAGEVYLDLDLSSRTTPDADAALADALHEAGASAILPVFRQSTELTSTGLVRNWPLPEFRGSARLASANLHADRDGVVRRHPLGIEIGTEGYPSVPSVLSGVFGPPDTEFRINFALDPATIPTVSAIDLIFRQTDLDFDGRSVVIGPQAPELRDSFAVPALGILSGAQVRILAAETLAQGRVLRSLNRYPLIAVVAVACLWLVSYGRGRMLLILGCLAALAIGINALAYWAQTQHALIVPVVVLMGLVVASKIVVAGRELDLRWWLLRLAELESANMERILERVISDSSDAILVADERLRIIRISDSARDLFGVEEHVGRDTDLGDVVPAEMLEAARAALASLDEGDAPHTVTRELEFARADRLCHVEYAITPSRLRQMSGGVRTREGPAAVCLTARDVTGEREQRLRIDRLARFDVLTGALNRAEFVERLSEHVRTGGQGCAVIAFNVHRLQTINTTLGRGVGDALLAAIVKRVETAAPGVSPVARLGGDLFAVFTARPAMGPAAGRVARKLVRLVESPFRIGDHTVRIGVRVGIAPGNDEDGAEMLLTKAELALDEARLRGGRNMRSFDHTAFAKQARARQVERAHWHALSEAQVFLAYQPLVRLSDGALLGAEALLRWRHPEMGLIPPSEFIEIAESSGFIEHLGRWVLEEACLNAAEWPDDLSVSVNVSPVQFHRGDVVADVEHVLDVSGLSPRRLCLEITESFFVGGSARVSETLERLRTLGVSLALDDFGSGFSSFGYLARLPLDKLKLDKMFVQGLESDPTSEAVTRSVVSLCRELDLTLLCEGVETVAQKDMLKALGSEEAQGYLFGRPEPQQVFLERTTEFPALRQVG